MSDRLEWESLRDPADWVRRLQAGEDEAWRDFIRVFGRFVPVVSNRLGLREADRQEVLQDMTVTALRSIRNLRDPSRLASWTFTIANRAAINIRKSSKQRRVGDHEDDSTLERLPSPQEPPDELMARLEEARRVRRGLDRLSEKCRKLLESLFLCEPRPSYKEISERHGMPIGSIGPNLARCLKSLRQTLDAVSDRPRHAPAGRNEELADGLGNGEK